MNNEKKMPEMVGVFSKLAYSFIDYKRSLGYKYDAEPKCISRFCRFAEEKGVNTVEITKELAHEWCAIREYESRKSRSHSSSHRQQRRRRQQQRKQQIKKQQITL